jgi:hypothetical protein
MVVRSPVAVESVRRAAGGGLVVPRTVVAAVVLTARIVVVGVPFAVPPTATVIAVVVVGLGFFDVDLLAPPPPLPFPELPFPPLPLPGSAQAARTPPNINMPSSEVTTATTQTRGRGAADLTAEW